MKKTVRSRAKKVVFECKAEPGSEVFVAGTFNQWDPRSHPLCDLLDRGRFLAAVPVPPGRHEYKFVINNEWLADPGCSEYAPNDHGSHNSVLEV
jgi:1,4-alpha-glucan branching enzyme